MIFLAPFGSFLSHLADLSLAVLVCTVIARDRLNGTKMPKSSYLPFFKIFLAKCIQNEETLSFLTIKKELLVQKRCWKEYNKRLIQRGNISFLIDPKLLITKENRRRKKGRPLEFSDQLIIMLLMVKVHFSLPYRMLEGFMRSIPSYSLICKRADGLKNSLPPLSKRRPSKSLERESGKCRPKIGWLGRQELLGIFVSISRSRAMTVQTSTASERLAN